MWPDPTWNCEAFHHGGCEFWHSVVCIQQHLQLCNVLWFQEVWVFLEPKCNLKQKSNNVGYSAMLVPITKANFSHTSLELWLCGYTWPLGYYYSCVEFEYKGRGVSPLTFNASSHSKLRIWLSNCNFIWTEIFLPKASHTTAQFAIYFNICTINAILPQKI